MSCDRIDGRGRTSAAAPPAAVLLQVPRSLLADQSDIRAIVVEITPIRLPIARHVFRRHLGGVPGPVPSVPRAAPLLAPLAILPSPILRRLSSPRVAALGRPSPWPCALRRGCCAALARGKSRERGVFVGGWCWGVLPGGVAQKCRLFSSPPIDFMAKHGSKGVVGGGSADGGAMHQVVVAWQAAHARLGHHRALGERLGSGCHCSIAASREQGIRAAGTYYEEHRKMCGPLRLVRALTEPLWPLSATRAGSPTSLVGPQTSCASPYMKTC
jgi:hypothetical protein